MSSLDAASLFSVNGLVAVVTGGGTGIGLMIATALEHNGATVYILGRREEVLQTAARQNAKHGKIVPIKADVSDKSSLQAAVDRIEKEVGYINLLVNNSGTLGRRHNVLPRPASFQPLDSKWTQSADGHDFSSLDQVRDFLWKDEVEDWDKILRVNVSGIWFTSVAFLGLLGKGNEKGNVVQKSQIVTVGSIGAFIRMQRPTILAKMLATNFVQWGIRSNVIAPGIFPSEMSAGPATMDEKNRNQLPPQIPEAEIPLKQPGDEQDMAAAILYLAGVGGKYLNGNVVVVDGGRLGVQPAVY
ncbi:hypothetical protein M409DRAFT_61834 [Zasmidium cellare ATCC 36951]|uniref:NAD(P)-binding protein n=1 Tax=Zasmidium cellare ATCC 36951 TaxID=1080233 RepID=A0A6A6D4W3_ZASCE|nr:uncharacterized protein M409DRAFT_61834 [Zasmidium cellare ATCC 36951]KAF2173410.1 hypothetical protein M409DRAFT_61834 [Zasmidium cellare ATCC 36951]